MFADDGVRVHPDWASDELICGLLGLGRVYVMGRILGLGLAAEKVEILPNKYHIKIDGRPQLLSRLREFYMKEI